MVQKEEEVFLTHYIKA